VNVRIFISYAHENKIWLQEFVEGGEGKETNPRYLLSFWQRTLDQLTRNLGHTVTFWFDRDQQHGLHAGEDWKERILEEIDQAQAAVLLITADFVVSPFIRDVELPRILKRKREDLLEIVPILLEPAKYEALDLDTLQIAPCTPPTPMTELIAKGEHAWKKARVEIAEELSRAVKRVLARTGAPEPKTPTPSPALRPGHPRWWRNWRFLLLLGALASIFGYAGVRLGGGPFTVGPVGHPQNAPVQPQVPTETDQGSASVAPSDGLPSAAPKPVPTEAGGKVVFRRARDFSVSPRGIYGLLGASFYRGEGEIVAGDSVRLLVLDIQTGRELRSFGIPETSCLAFTRTGDRALTARGPINLWDTLSGAALNRIEAFASALAFSPDQRHLLANGNADRSGENQMCLYGLDSSQPTACVRLSETGPRRGRSVTAMAFLPQGKAALGASTDGSVYLWDLKSATPSRRLQGHTSFVFSVAVSQDGRHAASGDDQGNIFVWNLAGGREVCHFPAHRGRVSSILLTGRKNVALSGGHDHNLLAWELDTCRELQRAKVDGNILSLASSPDGSKVVSAGGYGLNIWRLD
jgi:hypothetical protein